MNRSCHSRESGNPVINQLNLWTSTLLTKSAAGRGSNGKKEAYGIKKLRELILELAVRGKLVPQDPNDEPASVLLERITKEKAKLADIGDDDVPFILPPGWQWGKLGNLAEIIRGVTYKKHEAQESDFANSIALMRANNIGDVLNFDNLMYVPKDLVREDQILVTGDLLIAMSSGSADLVGKAAQVKSDIGATFGAFCGVVRPDSLELWDYLGFFFRTPLYRDQTAKAGKGIGINNLNKSALENLRVVIPPLAEQHRIVAKVDELMALCDQLEHQQTQSIEAHQTLVETLLSTLTRVASPQELSEAWTRVASHFDTLFTTEHSIDQLKQTILQLAVMGKLVPQDPNDEPADALYTRIQSIKERLIINGTIKRASVMPNPTENKSNSIPIGWLWTRLGAVFDVRDGTHDTPKYTDKGFPLITSKNIYTGRLLFDDVKLISEKDHRQICERSRVSRGDILFAMIGSIGNPVIVDTDREFSIKNVALFKYYASEDAEPRFLLMYLNLVAGEMREKAAGGVQSFVSLGFLRNYLFPLPPLAEQHRIVAKVDELMALCDALKARIKDAQTTQIHLADAIVEQAVA